MKTVNRDDLINGWLKYHGLTVEELIKTEPPELLKSPDWFKKYAVTQEQYDEWERWAKAYIKNITKLPKKYIDHNFGIIALDCGPSINQN